MTKRAPAAPTPETPQQARRREYNRQYHQDNRERNKARMSRNYHRLHPADKLLRLWRSKAQPSMPKPGTARANDARNVAIARAFVHWSDVDEVVRMCVAAAVMTELTGVRYVLDHIVPISSRLVCGLHAHTNLRVVTVEENQRKGHWAWPDMWPITWELLDP